MDNSNVVALTFESPRTASDVDIELDTESLLSFGMQVREPPLHDYLERLMMSQALDDLQKLVWP